MSGAPPTARTEFDVASPRFLTWAPDASSGAGSAPDVALVTTMKGCDERCSFCTCRTRVAPSATVPRAEIVDEVRRLVLAGSREVLLLGQTVDSFRDPSLPAAGGDDGDPASPGDETQFPHLLRLIAREAPPGLARLRYTSPHPRHATEALARAHAELDVLARHIHLPVQSGSDRV